MIHFADCECVCVFPGELQSVDGYMNIALEKCQEYVQGQLKRTYGDAFVRGNNGSYIATMHLVTRLARKRLL